MPSEAGRRLSADRSRTLLIIELFVVEVETCREVPVEEARLGERQVDLHTLERTGESQTQVLAVAEQVAFGDRHVADHAFTRRVAGTERKLARRLFFHHHVEHDAVRRRARASLDIDILEDAQTLQALLGAIDEHAVEGIAFRKPELAADHVILRAIVADDVDALDVDSGPSSTT